MKLKNSKNTKKITKIAIFVLFICSFLLLILLLCFSLILIFGDGEEEENQKKETYQYRMFKMNAETSFSSAGFTNIHKELKEGEYISYQDDLGNYNLISNFDSHEYICRGSCICEVEEESFDNRRRMMSNIFTYPLFQLIAATTISIAIIVAKNRFESDCEDFIDSYDACPSNGIIRSEVDDCDERGTTTTTGSGGRAASPLDDGFYEDLSVREKFEKEDKEDKEKKSSFFRDMKYRNRKFECSGKCQDLYFYERNLETDRDTRAWYLKVYENMKERWNKDKIAVEKREVGKVWKKMEFKEDCSNILLRLQSVEYLMTDELLELEKTQAKGWEDEQLLYARRVFAEDNLSHHCIIMSMAEVPKIANDFYEPICIGQNPKVVEINPTVKCTRSAPDEPEQNEIEQIAEEAVTTERVDE